MCQRNVSKGSMGRAHLGQMPLVETPYSMICVDLVRPLSPPSEGHRFMLTVIDLCTRFPDAIERYLHQYGRRGVDKNFQRRLNSAKNRQ